MGTSGADRADKITGLKDSSAKLVMLRAGNACIELFEYSSPQARPGDPNRPACDHGITHLCLDVRDIEAEYERLRAAGMVFHCPPQNIGGVSATYGRDPDGNTSIAGGQRRQQPDRIESRAPRITAAATLTIVAHPSPQCSCPVILSRPDAVSKDLAAHSFCAVILRDASVEDESRGRSAA